MIRFLDTANTCKPGTMVDVVFLKFSEAFDAVTLDICAQLIQIIPVISRVTWTQNWLENHKKYR